MFSHRPISTGHGAPIGLPPGDRVPDPAHRPGDHRHPGRDHDRLPPEQAHPRWRGPIDPRTPLDAGLHRPLQQGERSRPAAVGPVLALPRGNRGARQPGLLVQTEPGGARADRGQAPEDPGPRGCVHGAGPDHRRAARHPPGRPAQQARRLHGSPASRSSSTPCPRSSWARCSSCASPRPPVVPGLARPVRQRGLHDPRATPGPSSCRCSPWRPSPSPRSAATCAPR